MASPNPSVSGQAVSLTANISPAGASGLVTFYDQGKLLGTAPVNSGTATLNTTGVQPGTRSLQAGYSGDATYGPSTSTATLVVNTSPQPILRATGGGPLAVGSGPDAVAVGDFNGDGKPDLAVANTADKTITVLLGNGSGGFAAAPASPVAVGMGSCCVAVGDFNEDGKLDLAIADYFGITVAVLLGDGRGGFSMESPTLHPQATGLRSVVVGDFNGDGHADLAVTGSQSQSVDIFLGDGRGGFTASTWRLILPWVQWLAVGDINGDGKTDLIATNWGSYFGLTVLLGDGQGGFSLAPGSPFPAGGSPNGAPVVADFNGDGKLDIALADWYGAVNVFLGDGRGGFTAIPGNPFVVGNRPTALAVGDFNRDGKPDIAVTNSGDNDVTILLGDGHGGFTPAGGSPFAVGTNPSGLAVADFNGDGRLDLAVVNCDGTGYTACGGGVGSNNVTVLLGKGPSVMGDFDRNGVPDLLWQNDSTGQVYVWYLGGSGILMGSNPIGGAAVGWNLVGAADFNNDGGADLIWQNSTSGQIYIWYMGGSEGTTYLGSNPIGGAAPGWRVVGAADFNGDGHPDLIWQNNTSRQIYIWYMGGAQGTTYLGSNPIGGAAAGWSVVGAADFNSDGHPDLIWQNDTSGQIYIWYMGGAQGTTYLNSNPIGGAAPGWSVVGAADYNADGKPDLVWQNDTTREVWVWYLGGAPGTTFLGSSPISGPEQGWRAIARFW